MGAKLAQLVSFHLRSAGRLEGCVPRRLTYAISRTGNAIVVLPLDTWPHALIPGTDGLIVSGGI